MILLYIFIAAVVISGIHDAITNKTKTQPKDQSKSLSEYNDCNFTEEDKPAQNVTNNYYTQNNTYVQQNNYYNNSGESKGHTKKVWKRLGYRVIPGESYAYKFYGNLVFNPNQVEKLSTNRVKYSEDGLAKKLLSNTKSKKMAKNILVKGYGYSESRAKNLAGYKGY